MSVTDCLGCGPRFYDAEEMGASKDHGQILMSSGLVVKSADTLNGLKGILSCILVAERGVVNANASGELKQIHMSTCVLCLLHAWQGKISLCNCR